MTMDRKLIIVNVLIHGFAAAHAATAAALSQTMIGDEAALATLTVAMINGISRVYGRPFGVGDALGVLGIFAGFYLGTRGAVFLVKWIPGVGNAANAITTAVVTEILGWATYIIVKEGKDPKTMSESDARDVWRKAKTLREEMKEEQERIKEAVNRMNTPDKKEYDRLMEKMKDKNISESEASRVTDQLDQLFSKYGI
jgi:uncharacterized protein (DUF697 family)